MRGGAVAARRAHNPKVPSSNLGPAIFKADRKVGFWLIISQSQGLAPGHYRHE